ncbi:MAG: S49 family peptidase, partial [Myxococcales bacterium]|nr:S49 family peptidase [Myxococcales bacterium]
MARGALGRGAWNASVWARGVAARFALPPGAGVWLRLRLAPPLEELPLPTFGAPSLPLLELLGVLERAREDERVDGVLLELAGGVRGFAAAEALRRGVDALGASGVAVIAFGERLSAEELLVACGARRLYVPEAGRIGLVGLRMEGFFLKDALARLGVAPDVVRVGSFKTAGEMFTRGAMSAEQREQLEALVEDRFDALVDGIARGRGLTPERVRELGDRGPFTAREAAEAGLVDGCRHRDELEAELEKQVPPRVAPPAGRIRLVDAASYHALRVARRVRRPLRRDLARLSYVVAEGAIHAGSGLRGVAADRYLALLGRLAPDPGVRGGVLRVASPGGDG